MPQTTVDLSGGTSGMERTSFAPMQSWSPDLAKAQIAATEAQTAATRAQATAQSGLTQVMAGQVNVQGQVIAAAVAGGAVQQQQIPFTERLAQPQAALNQVLTQQAPAGRAATDAMAELSSLLLPIDNQVAHGAISADTLRFKLLDLARAVGLNNDAWDALNSGTLDSVGAMDRLITATADLSPEFKAVQDYEQHAGATSNEAALRWLQAAEHYQAAKDTLTATPAGAAPILPPIPPATISSIDTVGTNWGQVQDKVALANTAVAGYQNTLNQLDVSKITDQVNAWNGERDAVDALTDAVRRLNDAAHDIGNYLDDHTFKIHVDDSEVPAYLIPHSPPPLATGLRQIAREFQHVNRLAIGQVTASGPPSRSALMDRSGGGSYVENTYITQQVSGHVVTDQQLGDHVHNLLLAKKRRNGKLRLGDRD
jgi:hypothetical protein